MDYPIVNEFKALERLVLTFADAGSPLNSTWPPRPNSLTLFSFHRQHAFAKRKGGNPQNHIPSKLCLAFYSVNELLLMTHEKGYVCLRTIR